MEFLVDQKINVCTDTGILAMKCPVHQHKRLYKMEKDRGINLRLEI